MFHQNWHGFRPDEALRVIPILMGDSSAGVLETLLRLGGQEGAPGRIHKRSPIFQYESMEFNPGGALSRGRTGFGQ